MQLTKNFTIGINSYGEAISFIFKNRLAGFFLFPIIFNILVFIFGVWGTSELSNWALSHINSLMNVSSWDFFGAKILSITIEWTLWLFIRILFFFFYVWFGGYIILILMSPVYALLSEKTEEIITGKKFDFNFQQFIGDIMRGIRLAIQNLFIELGLTIIFFIIGFIPIIGLIAPFAIFIIASYFYGFSFIDYSLERKKLNIKSTSQFVSNNGGLAIGNGLLFSLTLAIPYIGILLAGFVSIISVVAATLSVKRIENPGNSHLFLK
ncbi:MAG: EI24 domain-containing protein [Marinilabiliaceae bacterium]|nr:EI24 domain-containing protein [Marinilabiliaceae bacterium]